MRRTPAFRPLHGGALAPVAVLALVSALAAGCSDDGGDSESDAKDEKDGPVVALTEEQISEALLQEENLGEGWTSRPAEEDDGKAPGCLGQADLLVEQLEYQAKAGTEFEYGDSLPTVDTSISAYAAEPSIKAIFDQAQVVLGACTTITGEDTDGNAWDLTMTTTEDVRYDDVDDQLDLSATGTIAEPGGQPVEVYIETTYVRVGPNIAVVATVDVQQRSTEHAAWAEIAVERLVDVAQGDEPEDTTAPAPA